MDGESHAFSSQVLEIDRAIESLARSGKLYVSKGLPQHNTGYYGAQAMPASSRYGGISHYATQRQSNMPNSRHYNGSRGSPVNNSSAQDYGHQYYQQAPPPLQQQYSHSQQQGVYPGPSSISSTFSAPAGLEQSFGDSGNSLYATTGSRYTAQSAPQMPGQAAPRSYSPFGGSNTLPPLSRLNTGGAGSSSHSTTPSISAVMSSSTSMLPPGYGRESFSAVTPGYVHSRAHSVAGSLSGLGSGQLTSGSVNHSRTQSISQQNDSTRSATIANMNSNTSGIFSPSVGHSRTASISAGSNGTPSPSAPAFNFFSTPLTQNQIGGSSSLQSSLQSGNNASGVSRITPIGRPSQSKSISEATMSSRFSARNTGGPVVNSSATASSVTSPLSNAFTDGWLDQIPSQSSSVSNGKSSSLSESQRKSLQSVWNN